MTLFWIIVSIVIFTLLLERGIDKMYAYKITAHRNTPAKFEIPFEEIQIPTKDGGALYGWWIPASPDAPTLILVHGWSRNVERVMAYIRELHPRGYNLLAFDARNHGNSTLVMHPTVGTFTEDILDVVNYVLNSEKLISPEIGLVGLSIGGGAAIAAAGQDGRIQAVITVGALSHPIKVMSAHFEEKHIPKFIASFLFGYMRYRHGIDFNKIAPLTHIPNAKAEIMLIHGENDETIPIVQAEDFLVANPEKTQLWIVPEMGHSDCHRHPQFWEKVSVFLEGSLPTKRNEII